MAILDEPDSGSFILRGQGKSCAQFLLLQQQGVVANKLGMVTRLGPIVGASDVRIAMS